MLESKMRIRQDPKAWIRGYVDGEKGLSDMACPYLVNDPDSLAYRAGYIEGKAKRLQAEQERKESIHKQAG
jgi:ribosome modulation factor